MGTRGSFPEGKAAGAWKWHSPPSIAEVKNAWSYTSTPQYLFMVWCSEHRNNFTFTLPSPSKCQLPNSKGQSLSWEANSHSPSLLWSPKVHCRVHKTLSLVPILSQINPVHIFPSCFPKIHSYIILPSTPRPSELSLSLWFSDHTFACISHLSHVCSSSLVRSP
jgi:hypothetical protein